MKYNSRTKNFEILFTFFVIMMRKRIVLHYYTYILRGYAPPIHLVLSVSIISTRIHSSTTILVYNTKQKKQQQQKKKKIQEEERTTRIYINMLCTTDIINYMGA